jgi:hypothetical protein
MFFADEWKRTKGVATECHPYKYVLAVDTCSVVCNNSQNQHDKLRRFERRITVPMSENESALTESAANPSENAATAAPVEEISYHAVEKDGVVTAIWEMQGRKHVRTIDPRSRQGQDILRLYTTEHHDDVPAPEASGAASS